MILRIKTGSVLSWNNRVVAKLVFLLEKSPSSEINATKRSDKVCRNVKSA